MHLGAVNQEQKSLTDSTLGEQRKEWRADGRESHTVDGEKGGGGARRYGSMAEMPHQQAHDWGRGKGGEKQRKQQNVAAAREGTL